MAWAVDVADVARLPAAVAAVRAQFGRIDVLVNNAGVGDGLPFESITPATFDRVFAVNVRGAFFLAQAVVPVMKAQRHGRIVNISSLIAVRGAARESRLCGGEGRADRFHAQLGTGARAPRHHRRTSSFRR